MPKISDEPLETKLTHYFKSDLDYLRSIYGGSLGVNKAIRTIVRSWVNQTKAKANKAIDNIEGTDRDLRA